MSEKTPGYVDLFAAVGVFTVAKLVVDTALEDIGVLDAPVSNLAGIAAGLVGVLVYIKLRNRQLGVR